MKRRAFFLTAIVCLLLASAVVPVSAKESWTSIRSKNFLLIGNGSEKEVRQVATRLEQFRDVFTRLFANAKFSSPVPTTVIVFKNDSSYKPFKVGNAIGYFQSGPDVNYITLTAEQHGDQSAFHVIFHEYVHLLVRNSMGDVPTWFSEGLAEYYSTFDLDEERLAYLGKIIPNHVLYLREQKMLPLKTLLTVDQSSPHYNEKNKSGVFYAQSWALVHYLIQGKKGERLPQMGQFLRLVASGVSLEDAFKKAFQTDFATLEKELKAYVEGNNYKMSRVTFEKKLEFDMEMQAAPITEADAQAYLGDLSLHLADLDGAEKRLQEALQLDPNQAMANSSLGMVRVRQGKFTEAKPLLQKAVAGNSQNYLVHFNYALALSLEGMDATNSVSGYSTETANEMRAELKKAIQLSPTFPESYRLLAFVNLVRGEELDESITLLKRALMLSPGSGHLNFLLAQLYMRKDNFKEARQILEPMARENSSDQQLRANAQSLLDSIARIEEQMARYQERRKEMESARNDDGAGNSGSSSSSGNVGGGQQPRLKRKGDSSVGPPPQEGMMGGKYERTSNFFPLRKAEAGEEQVLGLLIRIDCDAKGVTFIVKVGEQTLKLRAVDLNNVQFTSFTQEVSGDVTCGARKSTEHIVLTYRPSKSASAKFNGEPVSIEFVPKDFELKK
jgi:tetratricopeptide (TPR) repeat protein